MDSMFSHYKTIDDIKGNEIELWATELSKEPKNCEFTEDQSKLFIQLYLAGHDLETDPRTNELFNEKSKNHDGHCCLLKKRIEGIHNYKMSKALMILLATICNSPGELVMYCNYFQFEAKQRNCYNFILDDLGKIFPIGFFNEETLSKYWNLQKIHLEGDYNDNLLDHTKALKSLLII